MAKKNSPALHANVIDLAAYRTARSVEATPPTEPEISNCLVAACSHCGHNQFLVCLENDIQKYDRSLVCAKCFESAGEDAIDALADILCGIDFEPDFDELDEV